MAFALALDLLDVYLTDEVGVILEEVPLNVRIGEVLRVEGDFAEWRYTLNCVLVPSCCAGECGEFELTPVGHVDIITPTSTYSFSIDIMTAYDWEISQ